LQPQLTFGYLQVDALSKMIYSDGAEWQLFPALTQGHVGTGSQDIVQVSDIDPRYIGEVFRFTTDGFGNSTTFVDAEGGVSEFEYDQNGQLIRLVAPDPDGIGEEYEALNRVANRTSRSMKNSTVERYPANAVTY